MSPKAVKLRDERNVLDQLAEITEREKAERVPLTETRLAELLVAEHGGDIR